MIRRSIGEAENGTRVSKTMCAARSIDHPLYLASLTGYLFRVRLVTRS
jgi:hypothetical protein